jgi:hypothetical protein
MDLVADGRLVAAVDAAGGFGILAAAAAVIAGEAVGLIHDIPSAPDVIDRAAAFSAIPAHAIHIDHIFS